jgi:2',3'-cyclic-nucleotide 2'-phosphodiesterase (5'-nucleotidase family)
MIQPGPRVRALLLLGASLAALLGAGASFQAAAPSPSRGGDRTAVLLAINDVYRIEGLQEGTIGGLARVRALRKELEREAPDLLMLHGGDFLFPSFASRMYRGAQMISVLNDLDGDPSAFDPRMFVTLGNHEFDQRRLRESEVLASRIEESQFRWLAGNITFANGPDGKPLVAAKNLSRTAMVESGGIRIGLFGLTIPTLGVEYVKDFAGEQATARELVAELRAQKAEVIVALTHMNAAEDRRLLEALGEAGPDLVIGGHEHEPVRIQVRGRWILKADAGARTATIVRLTRKADGTVLVNSELRPLGGDSPSPDPQVQTLVDEWQSRQQREFCAAAKTGPDCLREVYGHSQTELEAEETKIRGRETSLGNWVADRMLEAFRPCGAQVAFMNSGGLRINGDLPAGGTIIRRHIEELFAYPTPLYLLKIDGATLTRVAEQSVRGWPGSGTWLQIAGFAFRHDTVGRTATSLTWLGSGKARPVAPGEEVLAVTADYLINPDIGDQDGYLMLNRSQVVKECAVNGLDLKARMIRDVKEAEPAGISPRVEGRICQGAPGAPCLAVLR